MIKSYEHVPTFENIIRHVNLISTLTNVEYFRSRMLVTKRSKSYMNLYYPKRKQIFELAYMANYFALLGTF